MDVAVEYRDEVGLDPDFASRALAVVEGTLAAEDIGPGGEVAVVVVGPDTMAGLNRDHRDEDGPTDVLSFPIDAPADAVPGVPWHLGDVVLCPAAADDPLDVLLVHGLLHLLGYDHEADAGEMLARQAEVLASL